MKDIRMLITQSKIACTADAQGKSFSAYRAGGKLKHVVFPASTDELALISGIIAETGTPYTVLGAGTNYLIVDTGYGGLVISTQKLIGISLSENFITSAAGESLPKLALYAARKKLGGMEPVGGIPSSVGGAVFMNAGAFGTEIKDALVCADCFDITTGKIRRLDSEDIPFGYRNSGGVFDNLIICSAKFRLTPTETAKSKLEFYIKERTDRQPKEPSLGCVFKNPPAFAAGYLIESVGLKGYRIGGAAISTKHANFIVNLGDGTAADYLALMELAKAMVYNEYKIQLEPEIRILG